MAKYLVTGGYGFIGRHLVRELLGAGHTVVVVDHMDEAAGVLGSPSRTFVLLVEDIANLHKLVWRHIAQPPYDGIFHLAAVSRTPTAIDNPVRCYETNVLGSVRVLELARTLKIPRVVLSSSNVVYAADTPYKTSKLAMEGAAQAYSAMYGVSTICLRYSNVQGSGIRKGDLAVFASLRDTFNATGKMEITGDGLQTRDFTHVSDVVKANLLAMAQTYVQGITDICTGIQTDLLKAITHMFRGRPLPKIEFVGERFGDVKQIVQDPADAAARLGFVASVRLEDSIQDVWKID